MLTIEMTGREDLQEPWKIAIAGFPGAGKTLLSSTASKPLFVFFEENPRIKSIARRHIPHVKFVNKDSVSVQDQLNALILNLLMRDHEYETLVIDTGDELFQKMKESRRIKNGGEFRIGDWEWIADAYREVISSIIDLPMNIIVNYHLKSAQEGEDGVLFRELALQGASKDGAPGWFDVVGVLDTFETADEQGDEVTKRVLLTHQSRTYPWVKDHSGQLPPRWPISQEVVGDIPRLLAALSQSQEGMLDGQEHQVLEVLEVPEDGPTITNADVPTPDELQAKKQEVGGDNTEAEVETIVPESDSAHSPIGGGGGESEQQDESATEVSSVEQEPSPEPIPTESEEKPVEGPETEEQDGEPQEATVESATALVAEELGGTVVFPCAVCSEEVEDEDLRDLTQIRFRQVLCRTHFKEKLATARS